MATRPHTDTETWCRAPGSPPHRCTSSAPQTRHRTLPPPARPWGLPLPVRVLLVLIHLPTHLTIRPGPRCLPPANPQWFIDGTLIPVRDQSITAISKNYRRSVNAQIIICAHRRRVIVAGQCQPANRNDVIVARRTLVQLLDGRRRLGDGGYRAITSIATPRRDHCGPDHPRRPLPGAPPDQSPRQARHHPAQGPVGKHRGDAINHSLHTIAGL